MPNPLASAADLFVQTEDADHAISDYMSTVYRVLGENVTFLNDVRHHIGVLESDLKTFVRNAPCNSEKTQAISGGIDRDKALKFSKAIESCVASCDKWFHPNALPKPECKVKFSGQLSFSGDDGRRRPGRTTRRVHESPDRRAGALHRPNTGNSKVGRRNRTT